MRIALKLQLDYRAETPPGLPLSPWRKGDTKSVFPEDAVAGSAEMAAREVMDIRQASEYLGISGDTLYRYASEGFIPAFKLGNRWRFKKDLLDRWMEEKSGVKAVVATPMAVVPKLKKPVGRAR